MEQKKKLTAQTMWGGRFASQHSQTLNQAMKAINASIDIDKRMAAQDIAVSKAHAKMLAEQNIIPASDARAILDGLDRIADQIETGEFPFSCDLEDIHMNIEARLTDMIGEPARRLHTARSRNDQVATGFRMWTRKALDTTQNNIYSLISTLVELAHNHINTVMPGFTHMQPAQPISLAHHLLAYCEMLSRDATRMADARGRLNESPLGAGALAGTRFHIDRHATAEALEFDRPMANSLDAVSARDFAVEALSAIAICSVHLSRLAEEITLWASPAFAFVTLPDAWSTGSSMMPQKRNPDAAELIRAKTGSATGALVNLLTVLKGLPLAYCKDLQEDKQAVFSAFDSLSLSLAAMNGMTSELTFNTNAMRRAASEGFSTATDLADWLTIALDIPFRNAHRLAGQAVRAAEKAQCQLWELPLTTLQTTIDERITSDVYDCLNIDAATAGRKSYGASSNPSVQTQLEQWKNKLTTLSVPQDNF